jgi:hypothetical protein
MFSTRWTGCAYFQDDAWPQITTGSEEELASPADRRRTPSPRLASASPVADDADDVWTPYPPIFLSIIFQTEI